MPEAAMKHFVREDCFQFGWLQFIDELGTIEDVPAVCGHRWHRFRYQFQPKTQCSEEGLAQQQLGPGARKFKLRAALAVHAAPCFPALAASAFSCCCCTDTGQVAT